MARFFGGDKIIKVKVSNGSTDNIRCRLAGDKALKVQEEIGGGIGVHSIGINAHKTEKIHHISVGIRGYTQIQSGNSLEFELSTSSKGVYMTIIMDPDSIICENHEISRSRNYIIDDRGGLLDAKKNKKWIDTDNRDHRVSEYVDDDDDDNDDYDDDDDDDDDDDCDAGTDDTDGVELEPS